MTQSKTSIALVRYPTFWLLIALFLPVSAVANQSRSVEIVLDEVAYQASIEINQRIVHKTADSQGEAVGLAASATHYMGAIDGFSDSAVRVSEANNYWRGVVVFNGSIHRINDFHDQDSLVPRLDAKPVESVVNEQQLCQTPHSIDAEFSTSATANSFSPITATAMSAVSAGDCPDPIDGVCLMPELELAYDLSYQAISSPGETVLDRATRELNELELFFERSFNYRLSNVTMTFLDASQDALFTADNSALDLLDSLRCRSW